MISFLAAAWDEVKYVCTLGFLRSWRARRRLVRAVCAWHDLSHVRTVTPEEQKTATDRVDAAAEAYAALGGWR